MSIFHTIRERTRPLRKRFQDPKRYVKTDKLSGQRQCDLLKRDGCVPSSRVLELGCGCLHLGLPLIEYLDAGHYVGVDPNEWLRSGVLKDPRVASLAVQKQPTFLTRDDFDAREVGQTFDFIYSHSVLSHAAHHQLPQYLRNASAVLKPTGRILASIRLAEGNAYGSEGSPDGKDSMDAEWVYPGVSYFKLSTVESMAADCGLQATLVPEYTAFMTSIKPDEFHDWVVFTWKE